MEDGEGVGCVRVEHDIVGVVINGRGTCRVYIPTYQGGTDLSQLSTVGRLWVGEEGFSSGRDQWGVSELLRTLSLLRDPSLFVEWTPFGVKEHREPFKL